MRLRCNQVSIGDYGRRSDDAIPFQSTVPVRLCSVRHVFTRSQLRFVSASAVRPYLRSDEVLIRIVRAASVGRVWTLASTELVAILVIAKILTHFPSRSVGLVFVITVAIAGEVATVLTKHRSSFVTNQRILVFDSGRRGAKPTKRLVRELLPAGAIDVPAKRWKRFTSFGEPLYFLGSDEFGRTEVVGPEPVSL